MTVLLLGGYGGVGRPAALRLAEWFPGQVTVAGRSLSQAQELVRHSAGALDAMSVDVSAPDQLARALDGARVVIMCVERANEQVARACLERGVHYVDVSASESILEPIAALDGVAAEAGAAAVLSVGVAPGLTNLLARRCLDGGFAARRVDVTILLGLGEHHGADAVRWTVAGLAERPAVGRRRAVLPGFGPRTAFWFPFANHGGLGVPVTTRLCFDSAAATWAVFGLRGARFFALARRLGLERALTAVGARAHLGSDRFVVHAAAVDAEGRQVWHAVAGREQGRVTGLVAAYVARALLNGEVAPGVHHIDQVLDAGTLLDDLTRNDGLTYYTDDV